MGLLAISVFFLVLPTYFYIWYRVFLDQKENKLIMFTPFWLFLFEQGNREKNLALSIAWLSVIVMALVVR